MPTSIQSKSIQISGELQQWHFVPRCERHLLSGLPEISAYGVGKITLIFVYCQESAYFLGYDLISIFLYEPAHEKITIDT